MPKTSRLDARVPDDIARAAGLLRAGGTVAFPTETVYGLGANALDGGAIEAIFAAKQRPGWDPLIVHLAELSQLVQVAEVPAELVAIVSSLTEAFWPGPLTLLLPRTVAVPDAVTAGRPLVGVRIPANAIAQRLLRLAAIPIAAPSANTFGHTSPTTAQHVLDDLDGRINAVLNGGATSVGLESTVLDPATMTVYRPGAVTVDQLFAVTGHRATIYRAPAAHVLHASLPSPGVGIRHYAPRARLILVEGNVNSLAQAIASYPDAGILLPTGWRLPAGASDAAIFPWGEWDDIAELARNLFAGLRALDDRGAAEIFCPVPPPDGLGAAIRDRLEKAARAS